MRSNEDFMRLAPGFQPYRSLRHIARPLAGCTPLSIIRAQHGYQTA
jgi:hypothetical protein